MIRRWDRSRPPRGPFTLNYGSPMAQGLVAWWPQIAADGFAPDMSMSGNHASRVSGVSFGVGLRGERVTTYAGAGLMTASAPLTTAPLSLTCRCVPTVSQTSVPLSLDRAADGLAINYFFLVLLAGPGAVRMQVAGQLAASSTNYVVGQLTNIVGVAAASNDRRVYLNGGGKGTDTAAGTPAGVNEIAIGQYGGGGSLFFTGSIGEQAVYNRALTDADALRHSDPGLMFELWYPLRSRKWISIATGIQFDAAANSGYQAASSSYTFNRTVTGANTFLAVDVSLLSAGQTVTSVIDDSAGGAVPLSFIGAKSTVTSFGRVESWGLVAPAAGTKAIQVNLSGAIASVGSAVSYTGVHQSSPTESYNSAQATNVGAADATVTVTPVADQTWLHAAVATDDGSITAGQTSRNNTSGVGGSGADEDTGPISPATGTALSYTGIGALATWAIGGYAIRPVSASSLGSVGSASGTGTATGVGASTAASTGAATGTGTATGVGAAIAAGVGSATGTGAAAGVGSATAASVGAAAGTGEALGVGAATGAGVGSAAGTGTGTGTGAATGAAVGAAAGAGDAAGVGSATFSGVGSAAGVGAALSIGAATGAGVGSAAGTGSAQGTSPGTSDAVGAAAGTGTVLGIGASIWAAVGTAGGSGAASGVGTTAESLAAQYDSEQFIYVRLGGESHVFVRPVMENVVLQVRE